MENVKSHNKNLNLVDASKLILFYNYLPECIFLFQIHTTDFTKPRPARNIFIWSGCTFTYTPWGNSIYAESAKNEELELWTK